MALQILFPSNSPSKSPSPRNQSRPASPLKQARSIETAKIALSGRLASLRSISFNEKVVMQRIGEALLQGDLRKLQRSLGDLSSYFPRWTQMESALVGQMLSDGVDILPFQKMTRQFSAAGTPVDIVVMSILLINDQRLLVLASDERFGTYVLARKGNDFERLDHDPQLMLCQIGSRLAAELECCVRTYSMA